MGFAIGATPSLGESIRWRAWRDRLLSGAQEATLQRFECHRNVLDAVRIDQSLQEVVFSVQELDVVHHCCCLSSRQAGVRQQIANVDCDAGESQPGGFGLSVEVVRKGLVEGFLLGQICLDVGVDCILKVLVRNVAEDWKCFADDVCFVTPGGAGVHVAKGLMLAIC